MKILQVVPSYYPATIYGGPIFSIHYACLALARVGVQIDVATTNANGAGKLDVPTDRPVELAPNYRVRYYDDTIINRFSWAFTKGLSRDVKSADLVHLQDVFSAHAALALLLARRHRKPLLLSARGVLTSWGLEGKRPLAKKAWLETVVRPQMADRRRVAWHATADAERDEIHAVFPGARVYVIANGIDVAELRAGERLTRAEYLARFIPDVTRDAGHPAVLVGLGRLHEKKAFDVAIDALARIVESGTDAVLLIAGADDGDGGRLRQLVAERGLTPRVRFLGEVVGRDKATLLGGADVFVFPSHNENFGNVALEAMAAGTPVVASRNTPWGELEATGSGRWVDNTGAAFAAAIGDLLGRERETVRTRAASHAERYDLASVAGLYRQAYVELIDGR